MVVVDGLSYAVFYELLRDIFANGWDLLSPEVAKGQAVRDWPKAVISALPSITASSRTSLLSGHLMAGTQVEEVKGFRNNADLAKVSSAKNLPILFHKSGLTENGKELAEDVRKELNDQKRKVVGVVFNAVDDHLAKGEQLAIKWNLSTLPALAQLLESARDAGRIVILTSDHGHILEKDMTYRKGEPGERYRTDDNSPMADEIIISGSRILISANHSFIFPCSEKVRYATKKHGYHGGVTPQEVIVPLAVLAWNKKAVTGWHELNLSKPDWWKLPEGNDDEQQNDNSKDIKSNKKRAIKSNLPLLDMIDNEKVDE